MARKCNAKSEKRAKAGKIIPEKKMSPADLKKALSRLSAAELLVLAKLADDKDLLAAIKERSEQLLKQERSQQ